MWILILFLHKAKFISSVLLINSYVCTAMNYATCPGESARKGVHSASTQVVH